jgi:hypothetical protein
VDVKKKVQNRFCAALKRLSRYKFWKVHTAIHIALGWDMGLFFTELSLGSCESNFGESLKRFSELRESAILSREECPTESRRITLEAHGEEQASTNTDSPQHRSDLHLGSAAVGV